MVEITSGQQLKAWLKPHGADVAAAIAVRAALRVVPVISNHVRERPALRSATIAMPLFRGTATLWRAIAWPSDSKSVRSQILRSANNAHGDVLAAQRAAKKDFRNARAGRLTSDWDTRAKAREDEKAALDALHAVMAVEAASGADVEHASIFAAAAAPGTGLWSSITADVNLAETGLRPEKMMHLPLWIDGTPEWATTKWVEFETNLLALDEDWQVWAEWYDDRLRPPDDPTSRPLIEQLEFDRVMIPDKDWRKGPKHVNAIIAVLEAEHRGDALLGEIRYFDVDGSVPGRPDDSYVPMGWQRNKIEVIPQEPIPAAADHGLRIGLAKTVAAAARELSEELERSNVDRRLTVRFERYGVEAGNGAGELQIIRLDHLFRTIHGVFESDKDEFPAVTRHAIDAFIQDHRSLCPLYPQWVESQARAAKDQRPPVTRESVQAFRDAVTEEAAPEIIGGSVAEWIEEEGEQPDLLPDGTENKQKSYGLRSTFSRLVEHLRQAPQTVKLLDAYEKLWDRLQGLWDSFM